MSDYVDAMSDAYADRAVSIAESLRRIADAVPRVGLRPAGKPMPEYLGDRHTHAAQTIVHEVVWGLANMNLDGLVAAAGQADRAAAELRAARERATDEFIAAEVAAGRACGLHERPLPCIECA